MPQPSTPDHLIKPEYYGGEGDMYQPRFVAREWNLGPNLFSVLKYIKREDKSTNVAERIRDLRKAQTYLEFEIEDLQRKAAHDATN